MAFINFKYDPSLPIMKDLIDELKKLERVIETRDRIIGSFINTDQSTDNITHLQEVVDSADKLVLCQTKKFIEYLGEVGLIGLDINQP
ncbi:unnamed protein product [Phytophthora lilii]|uniref:Unnamed protein product n=1 Tax=Phytophthora lilii TaxID=2077276 RepID=A0A9W6XXR0_9STRA|nr:unnamed protein product [Phytophthora lilii]